MEYLRDTNKIPLYYSVKIVYLHRKTYYACKRSQKLEMIDRKLLILGVCYVRGK